MKRELAASKVTLGRIGATPIRKPNLREIAWNVLLPLVLLALIVGAVAYAVARGIHETAMDVRMDTIQAVEKKATVGKTEILNEVKKNTQSLRRVEEQFRRHQDNATKFREDTIKFKKHVEDKLGD
jgi:hypothetical protein